MYFVELRQIKEWDQQTMVDRAITSAQLMEQAGNALSRKIMELFTDHNTPFIIICGTGNNGGDGMVIARVLRNNFYNVRVVEVNMGNTPSADYKFMKSQLLACGNVELSQWKKDTLSGLKKTTVVVDAILGSGTNREVSSLVAEAIDEINSSSFTYHQH